MGVKGEWENQTYLGLGRHWGVPLRLEESRLDLHPVALLGVLEGHLAGGLWERGGGASVRMPAHACMLACVCVCGLP